MVRYIYPAENSQGKWNGTTNSDNNKGWKSDGYLRYSLKIFIEPKLRITHMLPILRETTNLNTSFVG
jgi:hypothetical protein